MSETCKVRAIATDDDFNNIVSDLPSSTLVLLYFHAPWAAPCAQMSTVLETLASTYPVSDPPKIAFLSINAEELPEISEEHEVTAVPYIVLRRDGKTVETISGGDAAKVRNAVESAVGAGEAKGSGAQLPPAQQVTRPIQPVAISNEAAADPTQPRGNGSETNTSKDLSAYAPDSSDPATAPEYSSTTTPGLSATTENDTSGEDSLHERLTQLTNAAPVMLFIKGTPSAPQCGFSRQLVSLLRENSVRYGFFNILADEEVRQGLKEFADWPTFPQLWMGGELMGGLDIVKEELEANPEFFNDYSVDTTKRNMGGPASAEEQARPAATA